jgi:hypothetical protein
MYLAKITFRKLMHQIFTNDDCHCEESHHEEILEGVSEEDILDQAGRLIYNHEIFHPQTANYDTIHVEVLNVKLSYI